MSLADAVASALPQMRVEAEANMTDECEITRLDPEAAAPEMDPETLEYPEPARVTVYEGKCKIQIKAVTAGGSSSDAGERQSITQESQLHLPVAGTEGVVPTDVAEVTASRFDESLVGRKFTVIGRHEKSHATARRLPVIEGTG